MANDLNTFNFDKETNEGILPRSSGSISDGAYSIAGVQPKQNIFNSDYTVVDSKRAPQNQVDLIEKRLVKVNRFLKDKFVNKDTFVKQLKEKAGADANGNLSLDDFKAFVVDSCRDELIARRVSKSDIEGFLSAFVYNNHGSTDINQVAPIVYEADPNKLSTTLTTRVRANPPPVLTNEELGTTVSAAADVDNDCAKRMRNLLVQIENKAFDSKPKFFHVFREMDVDGDGFISYKDFESHLEKNKIFATKEEVVTLMQKVLDTEQKGYIDFPTFQKKFRPRMSDQVVVEENELYVNNLVPNLEKLNEYGEKQAQLKQSITEINKVFRPDPDTISK